MRLRFLRFGVKNIRDFANFEVWLSPKKGRDPYRVSLIQMPNGTGKTTTHKLLAWSISGHNPSEDEVKELRPTKFAASEGSFELLIAIDDRLFSVRLELDYDEGKAKYKTSRPEIARGGQESGHNLPPGVTKVITEQFARLFIFDGELAKQMLEKDHTEAETAIKSLYFLDRLDQLSGRVDTAVEYARTRAESTAARTNQGLKNLRTQLGNIKDQERVLTEQLKEVDQQLESQKDSLTDREGKLRELRERFADLDVRYRKKTEEIQVKVDEIKSNAFAVLRHLTRPSQFSPWARAQVTSLAEKMVTLKLPRTTSAEFFQELAQSGECICGAPMNDQMRTRILANAETYLSEDITAVMNALKHSIRGMSDYQNIGPLAEKVTSLRADLGQLNNERDALSGTLDEPTRIHMKELEHEIDTVRDDIEDLDLTRKYLTEADTTFVKDHGLEWKDNLPLCRRRIKELEGKVSEAAKTVKFEKQAGLLKLITAEVGEKTLQALKDSLVKKANKRISKILHGEDIVIDRIDKCLILDKKTGVSEGQSLAVAYAFLSTMFEDSPHRVPFAVDSPAVSLDIEVRREVSELLPSLFDQLVIFILSSEREGFLEGIERKGNVLYCTVFKDQKIPGKIHIHDDRSFFVTFQSEED